MFNTTTRINLFLEQAIKMIEAGKHGYAYAELRAALAECNKEPNTINIGKRNKIFAAMSSLRKLTRLA